MKTRNLIAALAALTFLSGTAIAAEGAYVGVSYAALTYKEDGVPSAKPTAAVLRLGKELSKTYSFEVRVAAGFNDDTMDVVGVPVKLEVDNFYGAFLRGAIPVTQDFSPYALLGYTHGKVTASFGGISDSASDSAFSYGLGLDYSVAKNFVINAEAGRYWKGEGYDVRGFSLGVAYKF